MQRECTFCSIIEGKLPCFKVYEDEDTVAFLDINPIVPGHTLLMPRRHIPSLVEMPEALLGKVFKSAKLIGKAFYSMNYTGVNYLINEGSDAGQIIFHLHCHIIPRRGEDGVNLRMGRMRLSSQEMEEVARRINETIMRSK
jgi:histidine triad (HIT) family protein